VIQAYAELDTVIDPSHFLPKFGLQGGDRTKALSDFSEMNTGYAPKMVDVSAASMAEFYLNILGFKVEEFDTFFKFLDNILAADPGLRGKFPQTVAAGALKYYFTTNGITINNKHFCSKICRSEATVNTMNTHILNVVLKMQK
jgi:hypothetical protein